MRFGIFRHCDQILASGGAPDWSAIPRQFRRAEQLGFDSGWLANAGPTRLEPLILAGALAVECRQLRIGLIADHRSRQWLDELATQVSVLDALSPSGHRFGVWGTADLQHLADWAASKGHSFICPISVSGESMRELHHTFSSALTRAGGLPGQIAELRLVGRVILADDEERARQIVEQAIEGLSGSRNRDWNERSSLLIGSSERVIAQLEGLRAHLGDPDFVLDFSFGGLSEEQVLDSMERFSREVMPLFGPQPFIPPTFA